MNADEGLDSLRPSGNRMNAHAVEGHAAPALSESEGSWPERRKTSDATVRVPPGSTLSRLRAREEPPALRSLEGTKDGPFAFFAVHSLSVDSRDFPGKRKQPSWRASAASKQPPQWLRRLRISHRPRSACEKSGLRFRRDSPIISLVRFSPRRNERHKACPLRRRKGTTPGPAKNTLKAKACL